jgi:hypothetical protein
MCAVIPDRKATDPSDCLDDGLDVLERRFLDHPRTTADLRNDYFKRSDEAKKQLLKLWESQLADEERGEIVPV